MAGSGTAHLRPVEQPLLTVEDLHVEFPTARRQTVHAVSGVSFDLVAGETLGLVGESGCGKSSTGRAVLQVPPPTRGSVMFDGDELTRLSNRELRATRSNLQMIFQDPISSLNPTRTVREIVREGLRIRGDGPASEVADRVDEILIAVGLDPAVVGDRLPGQFSGGQCQRICIARALVLGPRVVVCDEPVSSLDVSVQAQILNLLEEMKQRFDLSLLFIAHDLSVVKNISDRVLVMYLGKSCEVGRVDDVYEAPRHPYTVALLSSIPQLRGRPEDSTETLSGEIPSPIAPPSGCRFRGRCPRSSDACHVEPEMQRIGDDHFVACHHPYADGEVPVTWMTTK